MCYLYIFVYYTGKLHKSPIFGCFLEKKNASTGPRGLAVVPETWSSHYANRPAIHRPGGTLWGKKTVGGPRPKVEPETSTVFFWISITVQLVIVNQLCGKTRPAVVRRNVGPHPTETHVAASGMCKLKQKSLNSQRKRI